MFPRGVPEVYVDGAERKALERTRSVICQPSAQEIERRGVPHGNSRRDNGTRSRPHRAQGIAADVRHPGGEHVNTRLVLLKVPKPEDVQNVFIADPRLL